MKLDVFNGGPKNNLTRLEPDQDVSGQFWRFVGSADGTFRLMTLFRGRGMCLDIFNGGPNNNQPHLTRCGNFTGQFWNLKEDGDAVRLTTQFRGPGICLDIFNGGPNDNQPRLAKCGNFSGQLWTLTKTGKRVEGTAKVELGLGGGLVCGSARCSSIGNDSDEAQTSELSSHLSPTSSDALHVGGLASTIELEHELARLGRRSRLS
jgi:hypothetical protein